MSRLISKARILLDVAAKGRPGDAVSLLATAARNALWHERRSLVLSRDLTADIRTLGSPVKFQIRPFEPQDISLLDGTPISPADARETALRHQWIEAGLFGCYVAALGDGSACFMQWLLRPSANAQIKALFGDVLPKLEEDTVMLEGAYTPPRYRRLPLMPAAMARIALLGREYGARQAIVHVGADNPSMIKATKLAGFAPVGEKIERKRLLHRTVHYGGLPVRPVAVDGAHRLGPSSA